MVLIIKNKELLDYAWPLIWVCGGNLAAGPENSCCFQSHNRLGFEIWRCSNCKMTWTPFLHFRSLLNEAIFDRPAVFGYRIVSMSKISTEHNREASLNSVSQPQPLSSVEMIQVRVREDRIRTSSETGGTWWSKYKLEDPLETLGVVVLVASAWLIQRCRNAVWAWGKSRVRDVRMWQRLCESFSFTWGISPCVY